VWAGVVVGIACFISVSPKTPLEFFDANTRDQAAIRELEAERNEQIDPEREASRRRMDELMSVKRQTDRIALMYDLANNPQRANSAKPFILEGFYSTDKGTEAILRATDENYRIAEHEFERLRKNIQTVQRGRTIDELRNPTLEQIVFERTVSRMNLEMWVLRQFQAELFWRNTR
jgi:hypothetical protein